MNGALAGRRRCGRLHETERMACHKPHADNDFLFTLDELQAELRTGD